MRKSGRSKFGGLTRKIAALASVVLASVLIGVPVAAEAPVGLRSTAQTGTTFVLTWDSVPGASEYAVVIDGEERGRSDDNWHVQRYVAPLTTYSVQVSSVVDGVQEELSAPISVTTTDISLPAPSVFTRAGAPTEVEIKGPERPFAVLQFERDGELLGTGSQQWIDRDVLGSETYVYRLRYVSQASGVAGPWSEPVAVTTPGQPAGTVLPAPFVSNTFVDNSTVVIRIASDDSVGFTGIQFYEVERNGVVVDSLPTGYRDQDLWYVDPDLPSGTEQTYRVRALQWDGTPGDWSAPFSVTTTGDAPIDIGEPEPTGVVLEDLDLHVVADGTVTLSWSRLDGARWYQVTRNGEPVQTLLSGATFYSDFRAKAGDVYSVVALAADGTPLSDPVDLEATSVTARTGPIVATRVERRVVVLRWGGVVGADGYNVFRDGMLVAEVDRSWAVDSAFADASVTIPDVDPLEPGAVYRYRVETASGEVVGSVDVTTVPAR